TGTASAMQRGQLWEPHPTSLWYNTVGERHGAVSTKYRTGGDSMRMNGRHIRPLPVTSLPSGPSRRLRTQRLVLTLLLIVALPLASSRPNPAGAATHGRQGVAPIGVSAAIPHSMWANAGQVRVRATPGGQILTELDLDQEVQVTGAPRIFAGAAWLPVDLWGALPGYVAARLLSRAPTEVPFAPGPGVQIPTPSGPH